MNLTQLSESNRRYSTSGLISSSLSPRTKEAAGTSAANLSIVGYYSVDAERNYLPDSSMLLYYKPPKFEAWEKLSWDLNQGIELAVRNTALRSAGRINHLLEWIKLNYEKIRVCEAADKWIYPEFVCSCGLLTALLSAPFQIHGSWIIRAIKRKGTIYLCIFKENNDRKDSQNGAIQRYESWGYKFEQLMLTSAPDGNADTSKPVEENAEFRCIFCRRIGSHTVLFSSELDGVLSDTTLKDPLPLEDLKFIELKTSAFVTSERQKRTFLRYKTLKWWCQSALTNTNQIVCGFRDDNGIVRKLTNYSLDDLINVSQGYWRPAICFEYCRKFLTLIAKTIVTEKTMYKFEKKPYTAGLLWSEEPLSSEFNFLPPSFLNFMDHND